MGLLASPFGQSLRALTLGHFGGDQICIPPIRCNGNLLVKEILATCVYLQGNSQDHLATEHKSLRIFKLWLIGTTSESIWSGLKTRVLKHES